MEKNSILAQTELRDPFDLLELLIGHELRYF